MVVQPDYSYTYTDPVRAGFQEEILRASNAVIVWTEAEKKWMKQAYSDVLHINELLHTVTIPMHFEPITEVPPRKNLREELLGREQVNENTLVYYFQGRLVDYKHPEMVIAGFADTWESLTGQGVEPNIACAIVGDGPMEEECRLQAQTYGPAIASRIRFLGRQQPQIGHCIGDVLVFPSARESFGMVGAEAAMSGNLVVASNLGTIEEAVGEWGRFESNQEGFTQAMINVAHYRTQDRMRLGKLLQQSSLRFTPTSTQSDLSKMLESIGCSSSNMMNVVV